MLSKSRFLHFIDQPRNVYENAHLIEQKRMKVAEYLKDLRSPEGEELVIGKEGLQTTKSKEIFPIQDDVVDFLKQRLEGDTHWETQNARFLNYHRSLTMHTFLNAIAIDHYIGEQTDLHKIKDATVIDVGGGTGHALCSFFRYPDTLNYFLLDPNLRLLHDQFIRMYPQLTELKMGHILGYAEALPFRSDFADLVMSASSIDHMADYKKFIKESFRVLKKGGKLLVTSHLELPTSARAAAKLKRKWRLASMLETAARLVHRFGNKVTRNDHTMEFENTEEIEAEMKKAGFKIEKVELFKRYFYVVGSK